MDPGMGMGLFQIESGNGKGGDRDARTVHDGHERDRLMMRDSHRFNTDMDQVLLRLVLVSTFVPPQKSPPCPCILLWTCTAYRTQSEIYYPVLRLHLTQPPDGVLLSSSGNKPQSREKEI
jgi:hypothetical protein